MNNHESKLNEQKERPTTIKKILEGQSTERQLDILARADRLFKDRTGRYFGGQLTEEEIDALDPEFRKKNEEKNV